MIILYSLCIAIGLACKSLNEAESINLKSDESQAICFKVDATLPSVLQLVKYNDQTSKKKKKKSNSSENEDQDNNNAIFYEEITIGQCKLTQEKRVCFFEPSKEKLDLNVKCINGPCKFNVQAMQESEKQLQIGKLPKSKLKIFSIEADESYRIIYQVKCENCIMKLVDADLVFFGEEPTIIVSDTRFIAVFNEGIETKTKMVLIGLQEFDVEVWKYNKQQSLQINHASIDAIGQKQKNMYEINENGLVKIRSLSHSLMKVKVRNPEKQVVFDNQYDTQNYRNYCILWGSNFNTLELATMQVSSYQIEVIKNLEPIQIEGNQLVVGSITGITSYQLKIQKIEDSYFTVEVDGEDDTFVQIQECKKQKCSKYDSIQGSEVHHSVKQDCNNVDEDGYCWFAIGVISKGKHTLSVDENKQPINIVANQMRISEIEEEVKHHYSFQLVDSDKFRSITFRVTSANVQMLVSSSSKCKMVDWDCKQYSGTSEMPIRLSGSSLKDGFYSITVEGMELSKYGIIIETQLEEGLNILQIQKGQVYQSTLSPKEEKQCYKYQQNSKNVVTFLVHGPNHKLMSYAYTDTLDEIPTDEDHDILSMVQALQLSTDQFVACVQVVEWAFAPSINHTLMNYTKDQDWMHENQYGEVKYSVVLYDADSVIDLEYNSAYYGQIAFLEMQQFSFLTYFDQDVVYVTKSILSSGDARKELQVYIGNMLYKNLSEYEYNFFDSDSSTFVLDSKKMKALCDIEDENNIDFENESITQACEIFLVVKSNSKTPVRYTLTIHKQDLAIQLTDGLQLSYNLQHIESFMHFYYQPSNKLQDINLSASTFYGKFIMHMNIWKMDKRSHKYDWPFIDENTPADVSSGTTNQIHRSIKSNALDQCWPECLILISVQNIDNPELNSPSYNDQFHVMVNQGMQDIVEGQKYELSIKFEQSVYFTFKNLQKFKNDALLTFSLLSFVGNGYIAITVNGGDKIEYPSLYGSYDFHTDGSYLQITKDQLNEVLNQKEIPITEAYLIISVSGIHSYLNEIQQSVKLEFTIHYMNMDYIQIMHASPHFVHTKTSQATIVQFYNYLSQDIFIKLHKLIGYGTMSVFICNEKSNIADCVTESDQEGFKYLDRVTTAGSEKSQILIQKSDKTKFCIYCTYIIKLQAIANEMQAQLTVILENDFVKLPAGLQYSDYVEKDEKSQYTILFTEDSKVEIVIQILYGSPIVYYSFDQEYLENSKGIKAEPNSNYIHITVPSQRLVTNIMDLTLRKQRNDEDEETSLQASHFVHDELFLKVITKSSEPCNYTIYYTSDLINGKLQDGKIHLAIIEENSTFLYENYVNEYSILNISPYNLTSLRDVDIKITLIKKLSYDDFHLEKIENITLKTKSIHPLQSSYELPKDKGLYEITLINNKYILDNQDINPTQVVEISVTTQDIKILPFQRHHSGYAQPQTVEYFEALAPKDGYLAVEIYSCQSDINFGYSKSDLEKFIDEDYDESVKIEENDYHVEMIPVSKGTIWMAIHDISETDAYYHISNHFYQNKKEIPFGKILAGGDGNINWKIDKQKSDSIQISFEHANCQHCDLNNVQVNYHIFIAQDARKLYMLGYCRNDQFEHHSATNEEIFKKEPIQSYRIADHNETITYEISFPNLVTYEYAVIGVMATVENFMNSTYEMKVFYRHIQVPVPNYLAKIMNKNRTFFTFLIIGMIFLIALLTLWLCYYIKRYRKTKFQLDFQLEEGAKIIAASKLPQNDDAAFQNNITMKYDTLEED